MQPDHSVAEDFIAYIDKLRQAVRLAFVLLGLALFLGGVSLTLGQLQNSNRVDDLHDTYTALCTFKDNIKDQANDTDAFLQTHPNLTEIAGIPVASIRDSLTKQRKTIISLDSLKC